MGSTTIRSWINKYRFGETRIDDGKRNGRPPRALDHRIGEEITKDPYSLMVDISTKLGIGWRQVRVYTEKQNLQNISGMWVPREMPEDLRERRIEYCRQMIEDNSNLAAWDNVIFEGERIIHYNKDTGRNGTGVTKKKFSASNQSAIKTMKLQRVLLTVWWTTGGFLRFKYSPLLSEEQRTDENYGQELLELYQDMAQHGLLQENRKWTLHRKEGPTETSHCPEVLSSMDFNVMLHPKQCPDISPTDYYIFMKFQFALNTYNSFKTVDEIEEFTSRSFAKKKPKYYQAAIKDLVEKWHHIIEHEGAYIGTFEKIE